MSKWESSLSFPGDKSPAVVRYPRSEPACVTRLVSEHDQPYLWSLFATAAPTSRLRRAVLRKTRTFLENGVSGHGLLRFVHLDPSGLIRSRGLRYWMRGRRGYRQAGLI